MARVSIYVPDDLRARMDRIGEAANWSEVVRPAILSEVASREHRIGANMTTVIERLRASKEKHLQETSKWGLEAGRAWATNKAEYADLVGVSQIVKYSRNDWASASLRSAVDPEYSMRDQELFEYFNLEPKDVSEALLEAFIKGAQEAYEEVKDKL